MADTDKTTYPIVNNSAIAVANWMIAENLKDNRDLTHLKLQKLLYYAQGWFLAFFDYPLFYNNILAWKYGPVIESVYLALSYSGKKNVSKILDEEILIDGEYFLIQPQLDPDNTDVSSFLEVFWPQYSVIDVHTLVNSTHAEGTPWHTIYSRYMNNPRLGNVIPVELIHQHFKAVWDDSKISEESNGE
jgi:uncharacterized phage-associated protein